MSYILWYIDTPYRSVNISWYSLHKAKTSQIIEVLIAFTSIIWQVSFCLGSLMLMNCVLFLYILCKTHIFALYHISSTSFTHYYMVNSHKQFNLYLNLNSYVTFDTIYLLSILHLYYHNLPHYCTIKIYSCLTILSILIIIICL